MATEAEIYIVECITVWKEEIMKESRVKLCAGLVMVL